MDSPFEVGRPGHAEREFDSKDPLDAIACRARDWLLMAAHCRSVRRAGNFAKANSNASCVVLCGSMSTLCRNRFSDPFSPLLRSHPFGVQTIKTKRKSRSGLHQSPKSLRLQYPVGSLIPDIVPMSLYAGI
jgi:hypothetical protein